MGDKLTAITRTGKPYWIVKLHTRNSNGTHTFLCRFQILKLQKPRGNVRGQWSDQCAYGLKVSVFSVCDREVTAIPRAGCVPNRCLITE